LRRHAAPNKRRSDLDVEDGGYDDLVATEKEWLTSLERRGVVRLGCPKRRDGH